MNIQGIVSRRITRYVSPTPGETIELWELPERTDGRYFVQRILFNVKISEYATASQIQARAEFERQAEAAYDRWQDTQPDYAVGELDPEEEFSHEER